MIRSSSFGHTAAALAVMCLLTGCVGFSPEAGLDPAIGVAKNEWHRDIVKITDDVGAANAEDRVAALSKRPLTADAAVQIALLRNKDLQAAFNDLGISEAAFVRASLPPSPQFSMSRLAGEGDIEIVRQIVLNLFALATLPERTAIASDQFAAARLHAAERVLGLAVDVSRQYFVAVAAEERAACLQRSVSAAEAAADLARQLGEAGNLNKLEQAREGAFYVELGAELTDARIQSQSERERLTRLMGLWGHDVVFRLPKSLPPLPKRIATERDVEAKALNERVDLKAGRYELTALAAQYGLINATRFVSDVSLSLEDDREHSGATGGSVLGTEIRSSLYRQGADVTFTIPIYDFGETSVREAKETYMAAANRLAQRAINARSQAREAYLRYRGKYDLARYYVDRVLPLRKTILEQTTLHYNGMLADVPQLILDGQARVTSTIAAVTARRDFFIAEVDLKAALIGGDPQ
jgi:outer membrane protein TolC